MFEFLKLFNFSVLEHPLSHK